MNLESIELIMQFRPIILFVSFVCAFGGLKALLSFFPKQMKHQWIKWAVALAYGGVFFSVLNTPIYISETIGLKGNENGEFFEKRDVPWACTKEQTMEALLFYYAEDGQKLSFLPCYSEILIHVANEGNPNVEYLHAFNLLTGASLSTDEYDHLMSFNLPEEAAKELAEIWDAELFLSEEE